MPSFFHLPRHSSSLFTESTWLQRAALLPIVLICLLLVSCNSPFAHTIAQNTDACSILTTQEVSQVLGTSVHSQPSPEDNFTFKNFKSTTCLYIHPNSLIFLIIILTIAPDTSTAKNGFNNAKQTFQAESSIENVDGLGDGAFFHNGALNVLKDNIILSASALVTRDSTDTTLPKNRAATEQLVQVALGRL